MISKSSSLCDERRQVYRPFDHLIQLVWVVPHIQSEKYHLFAMLEGWLLDLPSQLYGILPPVVGVDCRVPESCRSKV